MKALIITLLIFIAYIVITIAMAKLIKKVSHKYEDED